MSTLKLIYRIYKNCKQSSSNFLVVFSKYLYYKANGKNIAAAPNTFIKGLGNISTDGLLKIGIDYVGFTHRKDVTYLNINGRLDIKGNSSIGRGCRLDIGNKAVVQLGNGTFVNPYSKFIIQHKLEIGEDCAISWNCQFLDDDFHELNYEGRKLQTSNAIAIGDRVWIGSNVSVFKGANIPNGCVIASNSVVKEKFEEENVLIAGNPARIIKRNVSWK